MTQQDLKTIRFITCGHVDDGKSTLLGRLLFNMDVLPADQIAAATENGILDYSRLTDGLEDERAQGITIDVAYRYVRHVTEKSVRNYRFADTPGHLQYLRNMAVAAPDGDVAILLVDASHGVREQTIRHAKIAAFFGIKDFVLAINKMDKIGYQEAVYRDILANFKQEMQAFPELDITAIPLSAIAGDNVSSISDHMPWYQGMTLQAYVSSYTPKQSHHAFAVLPVQHVSRITDTLRGYAGTLRGGGLHVGDVLKTSSTHQAMKVTDIYHSAHKTNRAEAEQSVMISIDTDIDLARGVVLYKENAPVYHSDYLEGGLVILDESYHHKAEITGLLKLGHKEVSAQIEIKKIDGPLCYAEIYTATAIDYSPFADLSALGLFILIEAGSEKVIAVGKCITNAVGNKMEYTI